jgi:hypothetical protein
MSEAMDAKPLPPDPNLMGLVSADQLRWHVEDMWRYKRGLTYAQLGERFGVSDEFVRAVLTGIREPSKAFLEAVGFERVTLYRSKSVGDRIRASHTAGERE